VTLIPSGQQHTGDSGGMPEKPGEWRAFAPDRTRWIL